MGYKDLSLQAVRARRRAVNPLSDPKEREALREKIRKEREDMYYLLYICDCYCVLSFSLPV